ncbi:extracellular solute-binding protein [Defluviitalea raffinosedens]|uniref:Extracellular solute-binding protein n=1 Tax=Defluviitalea raffinosedens TaxID=1450156 RepID=A0A7C8HI79_9FIRM|nr:ABC transporter substrate-binding protein [Defluviitalea raffinosedens]KAE9634448.1 extracellular solute-binding protein [Defluviitalea raffinosedens]HHW66987.1 extracellular solute-binding protein [Candidatus Epulonipiscium sp.]
MKKKFLSMLLAVMMLATTMVGCGGNKQTQEGQPSTPSTTEETTQKEDTSNTGDGSKHVTVYSPHPAEPLNAGIKEFQEKTGITVDLVAAGTGELLKRIEAESANPLCDVFWGGGADSLAAYTEYFEPFTPEDMANIDAAYVDPNHMWTGESPLPMVIMYNKKLVAESDVPQGWSDLTDPKFKGQIAYADPAKSGSSYTILCTMLTAFGKDDGKGWEFIEKFVENLDGKILSSSGDVYKKVADGEYAVGLTLEKEAIKYVQAGADVGIVYPKEGTSAVPDGIALVKGSKNKENAEIFLNFVLSKECQSMMAADFGRRPVRTDTNPPEGLPPMSEIPMVDYDFDWASSQKENIMNQWKEIIVQ